MNYKIAFHTDAGINKETNQDSGCIKIAATDKGRKVTGQAKLFKIKNILGIS